MKKMNILFIGGTKFIGKELANRMLTEGHNVTIFSRSDQSIPGAKIVTGDREIAADLTKLSRAIGDIVYDAVYDMCTYSPEHAETLYAIIRSHTDRLIMFSTAAVYPETQYFPMNESRVPGPHPSFGDYGTKKAAAEEFYSNVSVLDDFQLSIIRPHYILGIGDYFQRHEYILSRLEKSQPVYIPGNGQAVIQLAWYDDVVKLFGTVPFLQESQLEIVNAGGDEIVTLDGLVQQFAAEIDVIPEIRHINYADFNLDERRFYDDLFIFPNLNLLLDNSKAKTDYQYAPSPLSTTIPRLVEDWQINRHNYKYNNSAELKFNIS